MFLTDKSRLRLIQLLGMLGSGHEGEMVNAARLVVRFMNDHKLYWGDAIAERIKVSVNGSASTSLGAANRAAGEAERQQAYQEGFDKATKLAAAALGREYDRGFNDGVNSHKAAKRDRSWKLWAADRLNEDEDCLSDWEIKFFGDFSNGRYAVPTVKQRAVFERVAARLGIEHPGMNAPADLFEPPPF